MRIFTGSSLVVILALASCAPDKANNPDTDSNDTSVGIDTYPQITDGDGDGVTVADGDCDDDDSTKFPGNEELCDGDDDNCNGVIDEGWPNSDGDLDADCVDQEGCDGLDNDGDGAVDEDFPDADHDGVADCFGEEICDGLDNNGDGEVDEGFDADGDGYTSCGSSAVDGDCDDNDAAIHPGAVEDINDVVDNDCDGLIDESGWSYGDIAITELMNNPGQVSDPEGEWFEVYNKSGRTLILNGLILSDAVGEYHQVTGDSLILLDPDSFFVFSGNDDPATNGDVTVDYVYTGLVLSNETDELSIYAGTTLIDHVEWDDGASMPDPSAASMGTDRGNYGAAINDDPSAWCPATIIWTDDPTSDKGSPGFENEYCSNYDHDGDGYTVDEGDCNDADSTTYPGAWEGTDPADNDCDGVDETAPVAAVSATGTYFSCDDIQLDGSASYDIESAALTYSWELTGAPAGSAKTTADFETSTSQNPIFNPDVAGDYTFTLTVNDGGTDSRPVSTTVAVTTRATNSDPVANAGPDQSSSATVTCSSSSYGTVWTCSACSDTTFTLDGTGSTDADADDLDYSWAITSGTYGSLSSSTASQPVLTLSGVPATYTVDTTETIDLQLDVTDCMGASSTDSVSVTFTCTGA